MLADSRSGPSSTATAWHALPQRQLNSAVHQVRLSPAALPSSGAPAGGTRVPYVAAAALCMAAAASLGCFCSGRAAPPSNDGRHGCCKVCSVAAAAVAQWHNGLTPALLEVLCQLQRRWLLQV